MSKIQLRSKHIKTGSPFKMLMIIITLAICVSLHACKDKTKPGEPLTHEQKYEAAKTTYKDNPADADALIWFGRRAAYLGNYEEAISIYTEGINKHPADARMLRHRGHRYISTRQYEKAIEDLQKAARMIRGTEDEVEPDGLPNARNIPVSTLHGNIWYHLGLAYYLKNDLPNALSAYNHRTVTEKYDDNIVSGGHWLYMIHSLMGDTTMANSVLEAVHADMDIIENQSYHQICMFYKGLIAEEEIKPVENDSTPDNVFLYGLGNWHLYARRDTAAAKAYFEHLLEKGSKYSFAYLAAEADWERLFSE